MRGRISVDRERWQEDEDRRASGWERGGGGLVEAKGQALLKHTSFSLN